MNKKILTVLVILIFVNGSIRNDLVAYYVDVISQIYQNGLTYQFPKNAYEHYGEGERYEFGSYDFVIIGAGAGGSVVANRLTEIENWRVLVLEAGEFGNILTEIPDMYFPIQFTQYNWGHNSTSQKTACLGMVNQECLYPRGKGVGGTSLINGLVYSRGHKSDYHKWAKIAVNKRWDYETVLEYFKKSEHFVQTDRESPVEVHFHSQGGYLRVENHLPRSPQLDAFLEANRELGLGVADYNANKLGSSPTQLNTFHGSRFHNAKAFLYPILQRRNLKILTNSYATKLTLKHYDNKLLANGVEFTHNGKNYHVMSKKEVILAAGVFGTPQILMLSGIGPKQHLESLKIKVIQDLEVGSSLGDHPTFYGISFSTNYTEPIRPMEDYVVQFLYGGGSLAVPGSNQGVGFYESSYSQGTGIPDIEFMLIPSNSTNLLSQRSFGLTDETYEDVWKHVDTTNSFIMYIINLHSQSSGTVRLRSKNPFEYPLIDSNFLSDPENRDINVLYEGVQLALKMSQTKAFRAMNTRLQGGPLRACHHYKYLSRDYWYCALRQMTVNLYHPFGTCPMGTNPRRGDVVDSELKVFGFDNLRIADASVFPLALAAHLNAPVIMVGEQLGDLVKEAHKESFSFWDYWLF